MTVLKLAQSFTRVIHMLLWPQGTYHIKLTASKVSYLWTHIWLSKHPEGLWHMKIQIHEKLVISALQDYKIGTKQEQKNNSEKN